jgi:hypothetical protein
MYEIYGERSLVDEKIELLKDFCILRRGATKQEEAVRNILATCDSEIQMEQKLYNMLHGKETIKEFISKNHMLLMRQM